MSRDATYDRGKCNLGEVVHNPKNWPTPRTGGGSRPNEKGGKVLNEEVQIEEGIRKRGKKLSGPPAPEKSSTSGKNHGSPKLNPNWVEQLMGLPIGWTDLGSWATESSPKPQN